VFSESFTSETMDDGAIHGEAKLSDWQYSYVDISKEAVLRKLLKLKEEKSPGPDGIAYTPCMVLKSCADRSCCRFSLAYIGLSGTFDYGIIPNDWKTATNLPIFKKGSRSDSSH